MTTALASSPVSAHVSPSAETPADASVRRPSLLELMEDGTYLVLLLRAGVSPKETEAFQGKVDTFLRQFEHLALQFGKAPQAIQDAKYAFCGLMDEVVLSHPGGLAERWALAPMQLRHFGEHLAGEGFFLRLEKLRLDPARNLEVLEVYQSVLLMGFKGRYQIEGENHLDLLIARVRQEIAQAQGGTPAFAPHAKPSFRFQEYVRHELPLWVFFALLALVALLIFLGMHLFLGSELGLLSR